MGGDYDRSHWQPDDSRKDCAKCKSGFSFTNRRHHCRNCGGLFCNTCSSKNSTVPRRGINISVRVCDGCYSSLNKAPEPASKPSAATTSAANPNANTASPARAEPVAQQQIIVAPSVDAIPQIPLANAYGIIKEEAGKSYLDVAVAAVREVVMDESQCSDQQYEFDAAGLIDVVLPKPVAQSASAAVALLLEDSGVDTDEIISEAAKQAVAEGLRALTQVQFPSLIVPFSQQS